MASVEQIQGAIERAQAAGDEQAVRALTRALQRAQGAQQFGAMSDRNMGLAGRAGVEGVTAGVFGLPALAYDGTVGVLENLTRQGFNLGVRGANAAFGSEFEQVPYREPFATTQAVTRLGQMGADALELPMPEGRGERLAFETGRGAISALTGAGTASVLARGAQRAPAAVRGTLDMLSRYPVSQTAAGAGAGAGGEIAAQGAEDSGASEYGQQAARFAGGLVGGVVGGTAPAAARATLQTGRELFRPMTERGREQIVGSTLRNISTNPDEALRRAETAPEYIPGSRPTLGQASRDPGLLSNENAIRSNYDQTGRFSLRASENNVARQAALDNLAPPPGQVSAFRDTLRQQTDELLNQNIWPNSRPIPQQSIDEITRTASAIVRSPTGVKPEVRSAMEFTLQGMQRLQQQGRLASPEYLYSLRQTLGQLRDGKYTDDLASLRLAKGELQSVIDKVDEAIEAGAPGYQRYLREYRRAAEELDSYDTVNNVRDRSRLGIEDPISQQPILSAPQFRRQVENAVNDRNSRLNQTQRYVLDMMTRDLQRENSRGAQTVRVAGSDTIQNMSMANVMRRFFGGAAENEALNTAVRPIMAPLGWLYQIPSQRMEELLVDAMLDPKFAADLMRRATPEAAESIGRQLAERFKVSAARAGIESTVRDPDPNRRP